jgi:hypothetical protein
MDKDKKELSVGSIVKATLIVVGVIAAICGIAYAIYKYFTPDYDDDFDDDFDDAFDDDDDLFEDDTEEKKDDKKEDKKED